MSIWGKKIFFGPSVTMDFHDILDLYSFSIGVITPVLFFILINLIVINYSKMLNLNFISNHIVELIWSLLPIVILSFLGRYSLYKMYYGGGRYTFDFDHYRNWSDWGNNHIKVTASQWKWCYEPFVRGYCLNDYLLYQFIPHYWKFGTKLHIYWIFNFNLSSLLDLRSNVKRYFNDEWLGDMYFTFTSKDVLHSWFVPNLGVKVDCVPGQLNNTHVNFISGYYKYIYGSCTEVCGPFHSIIPIKLITL